MKLIQDLGMQYTTVKSKKKRRFGLFECPRCLSHFRADVQNVKGGNSTKCYPCAKKNKCNLKHGKSGSKIYSIWRNMKARCNNKKRPHYNSYGGRGIKVCEEWNSSSVFIKWAESSGYNGDLTIERVDNDGDYGPDNCVWIPFSDQCYNKRPIQKNNSSGFRGVGWNKAKKKYVSCITFKGEIIRIGSFSNPLDAAKSRNEYIDKHNLPLVKNEI